MYYINFKVDQHISKNLNNYLNDKNNDIRKNWSRMLLGYAQLWGLLAGYTKQIKLNNEFKKKQLHIQDLLILQADGEIPELLRYFSYVQRKVQTKVGDKDYFQKVKEL